MQCRAALEAVLRSGLVVRPGPVISPILWLSWKDMPCVHLLPAVDQTLLDWRNAFLFFYALLDIYQLLIVRSCREDSADLYL